MVTRRQHHPVETFDLLARSGFKRLRRGGQRRKRPAISSERERLVRAQDVSEGEDRSGDLRHPRETGERAFEVLGVGRLPDSFPVEQVEDGCHAAGSRRSSVRANSRMRSNPRGQPTSTIGMEVVASGRPPERREECEPVSLRAEKGDGAVVLDEIVRHRRILVLGPDPPEISASWLALSSDGIESSGVEVVAVNHGNDEAEPPERIEKDAVVEPIACRGDLRVGVLVQNNEIDVPFRPSRGFRRALGSVAPER